MHCVLFLLALLLGAAGAAFAAERELPHYAPDRHLGVQTCAGSPCHGRTTPGKGNVLQNEYLTWSRYDAHSKAYEVLGEERSQRRQPADARGQAGELIAVHAQLSERREPVQRLRQAVQGIRVEI